jgi:hypothetical protein
VGCTLSQVWLLQNSTTNTAEGNPPLIASAAGLKHKRQKGSKKVSSFPFHVHRGLMLFADTVRRRSLGFSGQHPPPMVSSTGTLPQAGPWELLRRVH